ncbi:hypothetical protein A3H80_02190 [Candidatus Roizmanbacteria bacterium RIFCSPLOWO2_02_FULL_37_19]|uniref:DUF7670 domain-containing protein n=1 Tax=Candidatus Roizmanbacteria bacterium RIFCSPHIGHO2_02_FULL_37_24 TaxID=1802037 RepID=A0A1F7H0G9_9BACT|nr:MAG: hypothetical protein A2862_02775 [Candidatus Roizmanbacteria bacterium RIFCSPHIGHO2_01_FULL_38_41]OGK24543.1 MAG: hypothetical protein A3C24_03270 [Candidatus Roizmanbacteria bacterium RIFCSPHIGHO2_02_FULL_37_24]OGK31997.1 MAG: hypothetical protein A3E10_04610 [Candidatus Roizmanbacteria bacterium RIFCSPHIGHO2_12_FULL_37_23]OGK43798.1 MAG: hypothetical protein A2956_04735 [Candidatus Roizmanbacteria bacterium RIFCSPLOWO2_01_FULL_37_57]OGK54352.1 MAG: hypothetical protein A3H80_02190 [Ca
MTITKMARIVTVIYIIFISLFALDIFDAGYDPLELIVGLFMHLIPSFIFIAIAIIAWKKERLGGLLFILASLVTVVLFNTYKSFGSFLLVSLPLIIIGGLFLSSRMRKFH